MAVVADLQLTIKPATALYTNIIADADFTVSEAATEGRKGIVLDFGSDPGLYARDLGTILSWPLTSDTALYVWQPTVIEQPESIYNRTSDWLGNETPGAKFIQGIIVTANSFNVAKTFKLQSGDDLSYVSLLETPATFNQESQKAFSCVPFVAHTARIVAADSVAWQLFGAQLVYTPYPELTKNWTIPETSLGVMGYAHLRQINLPLISTATVTLTLRFDQWPDIVITIPSTGGLFQKIKQNVDANKWKLMQISLTSAEPFRVFASDVEVAVGQWGRQSPYAILKVIGGPNVPSAVV